MTVSYCAFLSDGRFVSTTPFTLSIVQCSRPDAMNRDSSLQVHQAFSLRHPDGDSSADVPIDEIDADAKRARERVERERAVRFEKLIVGEDTHLAHIETGVWGEDPVWFQVCLFEGGCWDGTGQRDRHAKSAHSKRNRGDAWTHRGR